MAQDPLEVSQRQAVLSKMPNPQYLNYALNLAITRGNCEQKTIVFVEKLANV